MVLRTAWSLSRCLHFGLSRVCGERDGVTARGKRDSRSGERACPVHALVRHTLHLSQLIRPLAALSGLICNATCDNFNSSLSLALQHLRSLACLLPPGSAHQATLRHPFCFARTARFLSVLEHRITQV